MKTILWMFFGVFFLTYCHTASAEIATGASAPDFTLPSLQGQTISLSDYEGKYVVLEWTNYDCPFVRKHYGSGNMQKLQNEYGAKGVVWLSVNSSAPGKQGNFDTATWQRRMTEYDASPAAVLLDPSGEVGRLYGARTTPHMFVLDPTGKLIYQGGIDNIPSADPADLIDARNYVRAALDASMAGQAVQTGSAEPYGCSVKYA